jgi:hypothetical protein
MNEMRVKITARLLQGKLEVLGGEGRFFHFVHHKTHMGWLRIASGLRGESVAMGRTQIIVTDTTIAF